MRSRVLVLFLALAAAILFEGYRRHFDSAHVKDQAMFEDSNSLNLPPPVRQSPVVLDVAGPARQWCVPKPEVSDAQLQANLDYVCGQGVDCRPIQAGGECLEPNNIRSHATYAMNSYYQTKGRQPSQCDFSNTGVLTTRDPSYDTCRYLS